jgi:hypothetical protein
LILKGDGHLGGSGTQSIRGGKVELNEKKTYDWPSRMKDLRPFPRPVEFAFPPKATVMADKTALFPPRKVNEKQMCRDKCATHFHYVLEQ